jgi:hypothetical protein
MDLTLLTRSHINACSLGQTIDKQLYDDIGKFYTSDIAQTVRRILTLREKEVLENISKHNGGGDSRLSVSRLV